MKTCSICWKEYDETVNQSVVYTLDFSWSEESGLEKKGDLTPIVPGDHFHKPASETEIVKHLMKVYEDKIQF